MTLNAFVHILKDIFLFSLLTVTFSITPVILLKKYFFGIQWYNDLMQNVLTEDEEPIPIVLLANKVRNLLVSAAVGNEPAVLREGP